MGGQCQGQIFYSVGCRLESQSRVSTWYNYSIFHTVNSFENWVLDVGQRPSIAQPLTLNYGASITSAPQKPPSDLKLVRKF